MEPQIVICPRCGTAKNRKSRSINGTAFCENCQKQFVFSWAIRNAYYREKLQSNPLLRKKASEATIRCRRKQLEKYQATDRARHAKHAKLLRDYFGNKCFICGKERNKERFELHEKNGEKHISHPMNEYMEKERFVLLCKQCHRSVHWCMKYLNMSWERLFSSLSR